MDRPPPPLTPLLVSLAAAVATASEPDATLLREPTRRGPPPTPRDHLRLDEAASDLARQDIGPKRRRRLRRRLARGGVA